MIGPVGLAVAAMLLFGCAGSLKSRYDGNALLVTHSPNPSNIHKSHYFPNPAFPYVWYYRTTVTNNSDRDIKVVWFEGYGEHNKHWYGSNTLNRTLRNDMFLKWFTDGEGNPAEEWMRPGEVRVCDPNWHGGDDPKGYRMKWAFIAIDWFGNDYYAEAIVESAPIK